MSFVTGLFNVFALLYIGRAIQLAVQIARDWSAVRQEPLTRAKQRLAEQAAFFLGVPPAVLIHETCHALAVLAFGGQVDEFGYRVFWGYVVPRGEFTTAQSWFIAIAGTLGSLAFGAAVWLALRHNPSRTLRYFGLRTFRFQIYFSLLYYPIFSFFLPIGDWRTIYNFAATPYLSAATALAHAAALLLFWRADRAGAFEMIAFETAGEQGRYQAVEAAAAGGDPTAKLQAIAAMRAGGAAHEARRMLDAFLVAYPNSAEAHLQRALDAAGGSGHVSKEGLDAAQRALALGLREPDHVALARQLSALFYLERGDGRAAAAELDAALTSTATYDADAIPAPRRAELHYLLSQADRRQGRYDEAQVEIESALQLAGAIGSEPLIRKFSDEKQLIENHAGRRPKAALKEGDVLNSSRP